MGNHTAHLSDDTFNLIMSKKHRGQTIDGFLFEYLNKNPPKRNHDGRFATNETQGENTNGKSTES
jgi:hypothetical protein